MLTVVSFSLISAALLLAIPVAVLLIEIVGAIALPQQTIRSAPHSVSRPRVAILVPAHNESIGLLLTISDVRAQMRTNDRLLVVADNCTDDTAAIAAGAGADVVERNDPERRGKGYALARGVRHLAADPPDVVIVIDADCRVAEEAIDRLAKACMAAGVPARKLYPMEAGAENSEVNYQVAEFAWQVKNVVRPLGLKRLGLPCQLMGTGMAFPWNAISTVNLASGSIVEDMKLGLDLALAGFPPAFYPFPAVTGKFPSSAAGAKTQRLRWEGGHLGIIVTAVPRLISTAIRRADLNLLVLALDVAVPPVTFLAGLRMSLLIVSCSAMLFGVSSAAALISATSFASFLVGIFLACVEICTR